MIDPKVVRGLMVLVGLGAVEMLQRKNEAYGNSALDPVRVFSKASPEEQIRVRLDDKISRLMRGDAAGEDVMFDLFGYLLLYRVAAVYRALDDAHRQNMTGGEVPDDRVCRVLTTLGLQPAAVRHLVEKVDLSGVAGLFAHLEVIGERAVPLAVACHPPAPEAPAAADGAVLDAEDAMLQVQAIDPELLAGSVGDGIGQEAFAQMLARLAARYQWLVLDQARQARVIKSQAEALVDLQRENDRMRAFYKPAAP